MSSVNLLCNTVSIIKNGQLSLMREVVVPYSVLVVNFLQVLKDEGYILDVTVKEKRENIKVVCVGLKYYRGKRVIGDIKVVSKPSRKVYWRVRDFKNLYNGLGTFILSTSKGILPSYKAHKMNLGGEVLCSVF